MFRTLIVEEGERLSVVHHVLRITRLGKTVPVPIDDLYCIVLDNQQTAVTTAAITELTRAGAHIVVCDEKHLPSSVIYPELVHYRPYTVAARQVALTQGQKDALWDRVVRAKLCSQAAALDCCCPGSAAANRIRELAEEVAEGDSGNREGIGAKLYFRQLFGSQFLRMEDDGVNHALNYGYAILRSSMVKTLYLFGYYPPLGIHHIGPTNPFNLGDDLMEPFRPIVDMWADLHHGELEETLTVGQRRQLVGLVNLEMDYDGAHMKVRNVMARYVKSFTAAVEKVDASLFIPPVLTSWVYKEMIRGCPD